MDSANSTVENSLKLLVLALLDKKVFNIKVLEVSELIGVTDHFIIGSSLNPVHLKAVANHVKDALKQSSVRLRHQEGYKASSWILLDYGDFVLHLFLDELRAYYDIEGLWSDAPEVALEELVGIET